jgi:hypothetical protein
MTTPTPAMPTPPRAVPKERAGLPACRVCAWLHAARACRATAAAGRGRRAGRYRSVGQAGLASHDLLCAHTPRLARERPAQRHPIGSGASARGERPSVAAARQGASGAVVVEGVAALGVGGGVRWMQRGVGLGEKPCWGLDGGERGVRVGGVDGEWVLWVGLDGWGALGWSSGACVVEFSGWVVACAVGVVG